MSVVQLLRRDLVRVNGIFLFPEFHDMDNPFVHVTVYLAVRSVYVDITVKDVETGITVKTGRVPDDGSFGLFDEDWDKALGPAEQEQNNVTERR